MKLNGLLMLSNSQKRYRHFHKLLFLCSVHVPVSDQYALRTQNLSRHTTSQYRLSRLHGLWHPQRRTDASATWRPRPQVHTASRWSELGAWWPQWKRTDRSEQIECVVLSCQWTVHQRNCERKEPAVKRSLFHLTPLRSKIVFKFWSQLPRAPKSLYFLVRAPTFHWSAEGTPPSQFFAWWAFSEGIRVKTCCCRFWLACLCREWKLAVFHFALCLSPSIPHLARLLVLLDVCTCN